MKPRNILSANIVSSKVTSVLPGPRLTQTLRWQYAIHKRAQPGQGDAPNVCSSRELPGWKNSRSGVKLIDAGQQAGPREPPLYGRLNFGALQRMWIVPPERLVRRALIAVALSGLVLGLVAWAAGHTVLGNGIWAAATVPVVIGLLISIVRDLMAGRMGVDAIALLSMAGELALAENLAAVVGAIM